MVSVCAVEMQEFLRHLREERLSDAEGRSPIPQAALSLLMLPLLCRALADGAPLKFVFIFVACAAVTSTKSPPRAQK